MCARAGGVWFSGSGFGVAFEATNILVVKAASRGTKRKLTGLAAFNLGGGSASSDAGGGGSVSSGAGEPLSP